MLLLWAAQRLQVTAETCKRMVYLLEQKLCLVLEFQCLDQSFVATHSFQRMFTVIKGPKRDAIKALHEIFYWTVNTNNVLAGNIGCPCEAVTEATEVIQQVTQQNIQYSVRWAPCHASQNSDSPMAECMLISSTFNPFTLSLKTHWP